VSCWTSQVVSLSLFVDSKQVRSEMEQFIAGFNRTSPGSPETLPAITRAGIAHLYCESIHPFEDGNGRIGRAIAEKAIAQSFDEAILVALATKVLAHKKGYYDATAWLTWFADIALAAQRRTITQVEFLIAKTKLLGRLRGQINERQQKALVCMFREGPEGFKGGLSAGNYGTITGASPATTTRDWRSCRERCACAYRRTKAYKIRAQLAMS
jgi:Fic family protein